MPAGKHLLGKTKTSRILGTAKVGEKGQIVIPKEARAMFHIDPGDTLLILGDAEHGILITKPEIADDLAEKIIGKFKKNVSREEDCT